MKKQNKIIVSTFIAFSSFLALNSTSLAQDLEYEDKIYSVGEEYKEQISIEENDESLSNEALENSDNINDIDDTKKEDVNEDEDFEEIKSQNTDSFKEESEKNDESTLESDQYNDVENNDSYLKEDKGKM